MGGLSLRRPVAATLAFAAAALLSPAAQADCALLVDAVSQRVLHEEGACDARLTPASTFKVALSLMGFDAGVLKSEHDPVLDWRPGDVDWNPAWKAPTDPARWIALSVVWYSVRTTHALGLPKVQHYLDAFDYGNRDFSGRPGQPDGLDGAWIASSLRISPREQAAFLGKLVRRELPVSAHAFDMTARITDLGPLPGAPAWTIHGKTGAAAPHDAHDEPDWNRGIGWFVGWATRGDRRVVFVRQIQDSREQRPSPGLRAKAAFLDALPALLPRD